MKSRKPPGEVRLRRRASRARWLVGHRIIRVLTLAPHAALESLIACQRFASECPPFRQTQLILRLKRTDRALGCRDLGSAATHLVLLRPVTSASVLWAKRIP
jgi:hypothetical protein